MSKYAPMKKAKMDKFEIYCLTMLPNLRELVEFDENVLNSPYDNGSLIEDATEILQMDPTGHGLGDF